MHFIIYDELFPLIGLQNQTKSYSSSHFALALTFVRFFSPIPT